LPGVGLRFSFTSASGQRVAVLHHHAGRREVFTEDPEDPDRAIKLLELDEADALTLADLLGGSRVVEEIDRIQQAVEGIAIDWLPVDAGSPAANQTIGQLQVRSTTGVTIVAVLRGGRLVPVPGPDFMIQAGDTAVVIGETQDIRRVHDMLRH
jgi:TrkA domain protein